MSRLALCDASGPLTDILQKLSGEDGEQWMRALNKMLRKENPWEEPVIFKTIKLGTGLKPAHDFRNDFKGNNLNVSDYAYSMLENSAFATASSETEVDLVVVSVGELGFRNGARRDQIYGRAKEFGLELCPAEVGPQLRRQYADQPLNEWLLIGMEPIRDSDGALFVFLVERDGVGLWLGSPRRRLACRQSLGVRPSPQVSKVVLGLLETWLWRELGILVAWTQSPEFARCKFGAVFLAQVVLGQPEKIIY